MGKFVVSTTLESLITIVNCFIRLTTELTEGVSTSQVKLHFDSVLSISSNLCRTNILKFKIFYFIIDMKHLLGKYVIVDPSMTC